jgi:CRISPR-associated endoribonuclease Cas6
MPSPAQVHGAVSGLFDTSDAEHHAQDKAWAIQPPGMSGGNIVIRFSWFGSEDDRFGALKGSRIRLGPTTHEVALVESTCASRRELAATLMRAATLRFDSPTWFARNGRRYPIPDPVLVYRGLEHRWGQGATEYDAFPEGLIQDLLSLVRITHLDGHTESMQLGSRTRVGYVGLATYDIPGNADTDVQRAFSALSKLASFTGVGAETPWGAGAVTLIHAE